MAMSEISEYPIKCFFDARTPAEAEALFSETPFIIEHFDVDSNKSANSIKDSLEAQGFKFEPKGPVSYLVTKE